MDAIELLEQQHRTIENLFTKLDGAGDKRLLFERLADVLAIHMELEERIFYRAAASERSDAEQRDALAEHLQLKRLITELLDVEPDDIIFEERLAMLRDEFDHHVEEEEGEFFVAVRDAFDEERLNELADEMEALAEELEDDGVPRENLSTELDDIPPVA